MLKPCAVALFLSASMMSSAAFAEPPDKAGASASPETADARSAAPEPTGPVGDDCDDADAERAVKACEHAINTKGTGMAGRVGADAPAQSHDVHELEKVSFTVTGQASGEAAAVSYLRIRTDTDSDGDGLGDEAVLRISCPGNAACAAAVRPMWTADAPGKQTSQPAAFVKEWGPATPQFRALSETYLMRNLSKGPAARDGAGWTQVELPESTWHAINTKGTGATGRVAPQCPAAADAGTPGASAVEGATVTTAGAGDVCQPEIDGVKATKSRSNIQNN